MIVVHIRGGNATGKTTAVKQFMEHHDFIEHEINVSGQSIVYYIDENINVVVLGKYGEASTGGLDGHITDKEILKNVIVRLLRTIKPCILVFEGLVYGKTYKLATEISKVTKVLGYEYYAVCFMPPLQIAIDRLQGRNGGIERNVKQLSDTYFAVARAAERLIADGVNVHIIDTAEYSKDEMWTILEQYNGRN